VERLNEEIRRRERVIRIFPNDDSAIRLLGAVLIERDEDWSTISTWLSIGNGSRLVNRARQNPCLKPRSMSLEG